MRFTSYALTAARAAFLTAVAVLPVSTAATNVAIALGLLAWLASGRVVTALRVVREEPAAAVAVALFALLALSALWSPAPAAEQWNAIGKFRKLLLIPIVAALFDDARWRTRVLAAGFAVGALTLALSYFSVLTGFQFPVAREYPVAGAPPNATVFKQHITQGWLMSLFAFGCLTAAVYATGRRWRWAFALVGVLAVIDNLGFVQARTGHLATVVLVFLWCVLLLGRRGVWLAAAAATAAAVVLAATGAAFVTRLERTAVEIGQVESGSTQPTSVSHRIAFYRNSLTLIREAPAFGHGLGSMATVYAPLTVGKQGVEAEVAGNPHNEYLNLAIQAGLGASLLFVLLLVLLARRAHAARGAARWIAYALPLLLGVSSLVNSSLWDFNEGHMFALLAGWALAAARDARDAYGIGALGSGRRISPAA